jgi:hypothetical protein
MNVVGKLASATRGALWLIRSGGLRDELRQVHRQEQRRRWLQSDDLRTFERRVYSQNGEDGILQEILRRVGVTNKIFVEFGVESGIECNCARLAIEEGWSGLFLEADETFFRQLHQRYRERSAVRCVPARVTSGNIESLLADAAIPREFDVLSIDIDGNDYWVWSAIESWRPRVVIIEYNAAFPPPRKWVMSENPEHRWDHTNYYGASLASLVALGRKKGYTLVATDSTGVNSFFVRDDLVSGDKFLDPALHYHYSPFNHPLCPNGHPPRNGPSVEI